MGFLSIRMGFTAKDDQNVGMWMFLLSSQLGVVVATPFVQRKVLNTFYQYQHLGAKVNPSLLWFCLHGFSRNSQTLRPGELLDHHIQSPVYHRLLHPVTPLLSSIQHNHLSPKAPVFIWGIKRQTSYCFPLCFFIIWRLIIFTLKTICTSCRLNFSSSASRHDARLFALARWKVLFVSTIFSTWKYLQTAIKSSSIFLRC